MIPLIITLIIVILVILFLFIKKSSEHKKSIERFKGIIDVEKIISEKKQEVEENIKKLQNLDSEYLQKENNLNVEYKSKRILFEDLIKELSVLEENLENISYGLYKPQYNYDTSENYKEKLDKIRENQKQLIKNNAATFCPTEWTVGGSKVEGRKMIKEVSKLMLRAFNGECDACISKVKWNNIVNMENRIVKAFEAVNKLGSTNNVSITNEYYYSKIDELRLEFELQEKIYQEKEEQRRIREEMREEEKAQKEIEKAQREATEEEERYKKALEKAQQDIQSATGDKLIELNSKIEQLENNLKLAQEQKQRAISRAQITKSGHIYIISNIGSFGENIYKIGMTRRLDPMDRIRELGDASVPFGFDIHAIIYSDNAPELENTLHKKFHQKKINLVNTKREFFNVSLEEVEEIIKELKFEITFTKLAEAKEYRGSISMRDAIKIEANSLLNKEIEKFPASLN